MQADGGLAVVPGINRLIAIARRTGVAVIFTHEVHRPDACDYGIELEYDPRHCEEARVEPNSCPRWMWRPATSMSTNGATTPRTQQLPDAARRAGYLVLFTRAGHRPDLSDCPPEKLARTSAAGAAIGSAGPMGRLLVRGEYGHDIIDEIPPATGEPVIDKPGYGAFYQTELELILRNAGISRLVLTGITTDVCVHSTLREAIDRGFRCIPVGDACAASNPDLHAAALAMIRGEGNIFGDVLDTAPMLALWSTPMTVENAPRADSTPRK